MVGTAVGVVNLRHFVFYVLQCKFAYICIST
jgi:hypothetical protein